MKTIDLPSGEGWGVQFLNSSKVTCSGWLPSGLHAADLHAAPAIGVEVDVFSIGRVIGVVAEAGACGESCLRSAVDGDGIDVAGAVGATAREGDCLAVGRPTVKPAGVLGDEAGRAASRGDDVDAAIRIVRLRHM